MTNNDVEFVAMHDEIAPPVGGDMGGLTHDLDAAEAQADELARELVVVARHEDHARAVANLAQQLLDDVVVRLRPVPAAAQSPAVDDVADQEESVGVVVAQEIERQLGLAAARAKMKIGEEDRPVAPGRVVGFCQGCLAENGEGSFYVLLAQILMSER